MEEDKAEEEEQEKDEEGEEEEEKEEQEVVTGLRLYFMLYSSFTTTPKRPLPIRLYLASQKVVEYVPAQRGRLGGRGRRFPCDVGVCVPRDVGVVVCVFFCGT